MLQASAQTIDTFYMLPPAPGTNLVELSGSYDHYDNFRFSDGRQVPNTSLDDYGASVRLAHYFAVANITMAMQVIQPVNYAANWQFDGFNNDQASGMRKLGAENTTLSILIWPYTDTARQFYLYSGLFLGLPNGSYDKTAAVNAAYGGWSGDAQIGLVKAFGPHASTEVAFDTDFSGDEGLGYGEQRAISPAYRIQLWANWDWRNGLRTSLGYSGVFGGNWQNVYMGASYDVPRNDEHQRIRAEATYWWTPRVQTILELDHDVQAGGGYQLGIGAIGKVRVLF